GGALTAVNWKANVRERIQPFSWPLVLDDVEPFILDTEGQDGFSKVQLLSFLD
ncbi:MAG: hypothetical protein IAF02_23690, partial [Anaerolineae bacterium]|nr:hypothetical protein [Anaerolineae bacterium]